MIRIAILSLILFSCSANYHLNKAVKKGAKLEVIKEVHRDTTWITDHYYRIDTTHNERIIVNYVPETRWKTRIEYRYDYKRFKDSLKHYQRVYKDSLNNALKTSKIENRTERKKDNRLNRFLFWLMAFFVFILLLYIVGRIVVSKLLK